ncbi:MAG TPA: hypothetical protein VF599_16885 [Pyrinomonadaceae bacterium]|jgi:hypothetical protein
MYFKFIIGIKILLIFVFIVVSIEINQSNSRRAIDAGASEGFGLAVSPGGKGFAFIRGGWRRATRFC